jgi:hypothetical protein
MEMELMRLPLEAVSSIVDQMIVDTTSANFFRGLLLRLVNQSSSLPSLTPVPEKGLMFYRVI